MLKRYFPFIRPLVVLAAGLGLAVPGVAGASYPDRPIRFIVPYGTGGSPDVIARLIAQGVSELAGQPVIVENRPGANGIVAAQAVARERADGYTLLVADTGHLAINPGLYRNLPYDPVKDFEPVKAVVSSPLFLLARKDLPVSTVAELVAHAKADPGALSYASSGNGSPHHLGMERFKALTGTDILHVPYKGVAESVPSLVAGRSDVMLASLSSVAPHIRSGAVRVLGVGSLDVSPLMPEVPAINQAGVPGFESFSRIGFLAPAGTPADRIEILEIMIGKALRSSAVQEKLAPFGMEEVDIPRAAYADLIRREIPQYRTLIEALQLQVD